MYKIELNWIKVPAPHVQPVDDAHYCCYEDETHHHTHNHLGLVIFIICGGGQQHEKPVNDRSFIVLQQGV